MTKTMTAIKITDCPTTSSGVKKKMENIAPGGEILFRVPFAEYVSAIRINRMWRLSGRIYSARNAARIIASIGAAMTDL